MNNGHRDARKDFVPCVGQHCIEENLCRIQDMYGYEAEETKYIISPLVMKYEAAASCSESYPDKAFLLVDHEEYECEKQTLGGGLIAYGDSTYKTCPAIVTIDENKCTATIATKKALGSVKVALYYTENVVHPMNEKFLPEVSGGGGDVLNENGKLRNDVLPDGYPYDTGTFYYDNSGYQEGDEVVSNGPMMFFKVSSDTLTYNDLLGAKLNAPFGESVITENELEYTDGKYCAVPFSFIVAYEDNFQFGEMVFPTAGIYMITPETGMFSISKDGIVPLDPKFLPEGIGGGGMKCDYFIWDNADTESGFELVGMTPAEFREAANERPLVGYVGRPGMWDIVLESVSTGVIYSFYYQPQPITFNKLRRICWDATNGSFTCEDVEAMS